MFKTKKPLESHNKKLVALRIMQFENSFPTKSFMVKPDDTTEDIKERMGEKVKPNELNSTLLILWDKINKTQSELYGCQTSSLVGLNLSIDDTKKAIFSLLRCLAATGDHVAPELLERTEDWGDTSGPPEGYVFE